MKLKLLACVTAITILAVLALPTQCLAQGQKLPHYTVVDLGTLGGTFGGAPRDYNFTTVDSPGLYQEVDNGNFVTWVNNSGLVASNTSELTATCTPLFSLRIDGKSSTCLEPPARRNECQLTRTARSDILGRGSCRASGDWKEGQYSYVMIRVRLNTHTALRLGSTTWTGNLVHC